MENEPLATNSCHTCTYLHETHAASDKTNFFESLVPGSGMPSLPPLHYLAWTTTSYEMGEQRHVEIILLYPLNPVNDYLLLRLLSAPLLEFLF